jgi:hypothetical protein
MFRRGVSLAATLAALAVAGCSGGTDDETLSAMQIADRMADTLVDRVNGATMITQQNDVNHLLGRPHGYTSAAVLHDDDLDQPYADDPGVDSGATVEVFSDSSAAERRADYIQGLLDSAPILGDEYDYTEGSVLLRVSGELPPDVAEHYHDAFKQALSGPPPTGND